MRRTTLFICGVAAGLAVLTACGQSVSGSAFGTNSGATGNVGGVTTVAQLGQLVATHTSGTSAHINMAITGTANIDGTALVKFGNPFAMDETMTMPGMGTFEMRLVGNTIYLKLPDQVKSMANVTTPWVKIDPNGSGPLAQTLNSSLSQAEQNADPAQMLTKLKSAGTITSTKTEELNGEQTTHYTVTVDLSKAISESGLSQAQIQQFNQAVQLGQKTETIDVWVNSANLPVKFTTSMSLTNPDNGQAINENITATFTDWGAPVSISAPPADQVSTFNK